MKPKFKIHDVVEVPEWPEDKRQNWIITDFVSNGAEAVIRNTFNNWQSIVLLSKLKLQKRD